MKKTFLESFANQNTARLIIKLTTILVFMFLISCEEEFIIRHEKLEDIDFRKFKTYAWLPTMDSITVGGIDVYQLQNSIASNIDEQLFKKGLKIDTVDPQMLVRYYVMINNVTALVHTPIYENRTTVSYGVGYGGYGGYGSVGVYNHPVQVGTVAREVPYRNGQLVVEIIDHSINKVVWRGYAYGSRPEEYEKTQVEEMRKKVAKIIRDIFWYCPVKAK